MIEGGTTVALAIGLLAASWVIVIWGASYFNKNMN